MALDVEVPDPPPLRGPQPRGEYAAVDTTGQQQDDDYRREEVGTLLRAGAWRDGFEEWAEHTFLSDEEFEAISERGLIERFDFYWDPSTGEVGYRAPTLADEPVGAFEDDPDGIEEELDALGRVVSEQLENEYLPREDDEFGFFADDYTGEESPDE